MLEAVSGNHIEMPLHGVILRDIAPLLPAIQI